ncbi:MAG: flagellin, partial [Caulobacteraceae bacterium]
MSLNSINTNVGAQIALQTLNSTNAQLENAQNQVSTGLRISSAQDDGAIWAIAQGQRSQITALGAVTDSLNRASSVLDVAVTAGQTISDLLN